MDNRGIERLWKSRENVLRDLELRRGYDVKETDHMSLEQFTEWAENEGFYHKKRVSESHEFLFNGGK